MQVVPPKPLGISQAIGKGAAEGLTEGFIPAFQRSAERQYEINQTEKGLALAQQAAQEANGDPLKIMFALTRAQAYSPALAKSIGPLYQALLNQSAARQQANSDIQQSNPAGGTTTQAQSGNQTFTNENPTDLGGKLPGLFSKPQQLNGIPPSNVSGSVPAYNNTEGTGYGNGIIPNSFTPQEYERVRQEELKFGRDPTPRINSMIAQDNASRARARDITDAAKINADIESARRTAQEEFRGTLTKQFGELSPADLAVAENIAAGYSHIKNDVLRAEAAKKPFQLYQAQKKAFEENAARPDYNRVKYERQIDKLHDYAQTLVKYGQRDQAAAILSKAGWGAVEIERILNPLPKEFKSGLNKIGRIGPSKSISPPAFSSSGFQGYHESVLKDRAKKIKQYKDYIGKNFKSDTADLEHGNYVTPGTSLLQTRDEFLKNLGNYDEFQNIISELKNEGKIELGAYQSAEEPYLSHRPEASMSINELMWRLNPFYINRR